MTQFNALASCSASAPFGLFIPLDRPSHPIERLHQGNPPLSIELEQVDQVNVVAGFNPKNAIGFVVRTTLDTGALAEVWLTRVRKPPKLLATAKTTKAAMIFALGLKTSFVPGRSGRGRGFGKEAK